MQTNNPSSGDDCAYGVAVDNSGIYVVGSGNSEWRIVKYGIIPPTNPILTSTSHPDSTKKYVNDSPVFSITAPNDSYGIAGYYYILDQSTGTIPDENSGMYTTNTSISFNSIADGTWYLHIVAKNNAGFVGTQATQYKINIQTIVNPAIANTLTASDGTTLYLEKA